MNVRALNQGMGRLHQNVVFPTHEGFAAHGMGDSEIGSIKGIRSVISLSMKCLEIILKEGHIQGTSSRDGVVQDNDPYMERLIGMARKGANEKPR